MNKNDQKNKIILPRRKFLQRIGGGLTALAALNIPIFGGKTVGETILLDDAEFVENGRNKNIFRFAVIADTSTLR